MKYESWEKASWISEIPSNFSIKRNERTLPSCYSILLTVNTRTCLIFIYLRFCFFSFFTQTATITVITQKLSWTKYSWEGFWFNILSSVSVDLQISCVKFMNFDRVLWAPVSILARLKSIVMNVRTSCSTGSTFYSLEYQRFYDTTIATL